MGVGGLSGEGVNVTRAAGGSSAAAGAKVEKGYTDSDLMMPSAPSLDEVDAMVSARVARRLAAVSGRWERDRTTRRVFEVRRRAGKASAHAVRLARAGEC